jgi:aryl-alcohol dehydrogenase-like predicted oxidoreductase
MTGSLDTAPLGRTGLDITRVGLGAWAIGGGDWSFAWGPQDDDDSIRTIHAAVDRGINWVDTAGVYGLGHSEEVVGRALRELPEGNRPFVFTKGGLVWDEQDRRTKARRVGDPAVLRQHVEDSLRRLGVETIDLFQLHWPAEDGTPIEEYWPVFVELRESGKVRAIGLSNHDVPRLERAEAIGHVDSLQPPFSAIYRDAAGDVIPWCEAHGTGVIVYSPMQSGLLTGTMTAERVAALPENDWRARHPDFHENLERNLAVADALAAVAARHGVPVPHAAIAWTLGFPGVTAAIVGARRPDQVAGWAQAGAVALTADDYAEVAAAIERTGAGSGPARP